MNDCQFTSLIKRLEQEILALKTASKYTSVKSYDYFSTQAITTGTYKVTYGGDINTPILSSIFLSFSGETVWGYASARTPDSTTQMVDVFINQADNPHPITVLANRPVVSIQRV